jgi:hypothetical protein
MKDCKTLEGLIRIFSDYQDEFTDYDSYYASRLLLTEFFGISKTSDYLDFVFDVAMEYIVPEDIYIIEEFISSYYEKYYKLLLRRLKDVSTNKQSTKSTKR